MECNLVLGADRGGDILWCNFRRGHSMPIQGFRVHYFFLFKYIKNYLENKKMSIFITIFFKKKSLKKFWWLPLKMGYFYLFDLLYPFWYGQLWKLFFHKKNQVPNLKNDFYRLILVIPLKKGYFEPFNPPYHPLVLLRFKNTPNVAWAPMKNMLSRKNSAL